MFDRVTCNCGVGLSELCQIYKFVLNEKIKILGAEQIHTSMYGTIDLATITSGDILDQLGLYKQCCRKIVLTNVKFFDMLGIGYNPVLDK
jgi:DNA-directed RNA polymerase subunit N (RpoN/RPB10)